MMREIFTVEEVNLICIFITNNREKLIADLKQAILSFDEPELGGIAESALSKLEAMSDADFDTLEFYPAYDDYEEV
jgi:hypothetical protein